jgi:glucosamine-6-phosphate deaminase
MIVSQASFRPRVSIFLDRSLAAAAAARHVQEEVQRVVARAGRCRVIFGCAPSQDEFFSALVAQVRADPEIWLACEVFHMDDYVGLTAEHPQSFRHYLYAHFLDQVRVGTFHALHGKGSNRCDMHGYRRERSYRLQ